MEEVSGEVSAVEPRRAGPKTSGEVRRAGALTSLTYFLMPPVFGAFIGGLFLTEPSRVPWVLGASLTAGLMGFLLATPLASRSDQLRKAGYRRAAELAILVGFVSGAVVAYTLVVYLLLGFRRPWAAEFLGALFGG